MTELASRSRPLALLLGIVVGCSVQAADVVTRVTPQQAAAAIDAALAAQWKLKGTEPAPLADDSEFLRRVTLDLLGRIPRPAEIQDFLADDSPTKRQDLVERLLRHPAQVEHLTNSWRDSLLTQSSAQDLRAVTAHFEDWLRRSVCENKPYDRFVREILTAPLGDRIAVGATSKDDPTPLPFYQANELQPENLASSTARVFLGINLECAQCHNHPFAPWKREQFWQLTAFFAGVERLRADNPFAAAPERLDRHSLMIPGTQQTVAARFLAGSPPQFAADVSPRQVLADWVTARDNPYFARAAVNRFWSHFFGRGLVEPLDELGSRETILYEPLINQLAGQFVAADYDIPFLIRTLTATAAYQRTSRVTHPSQQDPEMFARMPVRGLTAEQLFASLAVATGCDDRRRDEVLLTFQRLDRPTTSHTSILQALAMMNGHLSGEATTPASSQTVQAVHAAPYLSVDEKIAALFQLSVSREPTPAELKRLRTFVTQQEDSRQALADVFWVLLNSSEFMFNH